MRACQGFYGVFGILALTGVASTVVSAPLPATTPAPAALSVDVEHWTARPFAEVMLVTPELAACILLAPGSWAAMRPPSSPGEPGRLAEAVRAQLVGVLGPDTSARFTVVVAESGESALAAVASGTVSLLIVPASKPWSVQEGARVVIAAFARAHSEPAARDPRCSEPLLALAEAISVAGSLTLATLPPELRPVSDWLDAKEAVKPLAGLVDAALDRKEPWASRRVRLQQTALTSGANAQLLNAAALVVESYGDVQRARREPYDLLLAWRDDREKSFPPMPPVLRRAVAAPLEAGMPSEKRADDAALIADQALQRAVETGSLPAGARMDAVALPLRALAAAQARAQGSGVACSWLLAGPVAPALRTGCRSDESGGGLVSTRPRPQGGFEIVAAAGNDELVLLRWPRWALFPLFVAKTGSLVFADREGIWSVPLDSSAPPRLLAAGGYRHLSLGPDGGTIAAVRWPTGALVLVTAAAGIQELGSDASGGVAWLDGELLIAAGGEGATVVAIGGERRPFPAALPCAHALARSGAALLVASSAPCEIGIFRVPLGEAHGQLVLKRGEGPTTIVTAPDETIFFADPEGIFRWRPGEPPVRIGGGLTPGPG